MTSTIENFLTTLRNVGSPSQLSAWAADGHAQGRQPRVNAHVHLPPNFSAFETTRQALDLADSQLVSVLGASNYYDYSGYAEFAEEASRRGIFPLFGLEIISLIDDLIQRDVKTNDPGNPGKMYLCGKGITRFAPMDEDARRLLQTIRDNDAVRMEAVTDRLAAVFAEAGLETGLAADAVKARVVARHAVPWATVYLQERHVAQAFQQVLFDTIAENDRANFLAKVFGIPSKAQSHDAVAVQNEIRSQLMKAGKPAYVAETFVDFDHAYRLVLALGGIPCYPTLADGVLPITEYEESPERLIADLTARGVFSAEFIPTRNTPDVLVRYVQAMRDAGLFVTAGTEHNTLELLPIEPTCVGGAPIPADIERIFWEGACVIAAHQYLSAQGQPGFVDGEGRPNPVYSTDKARIEAFAALGAAVIARFQEGAR